MAPSPTRAITGRDGWANFAPIAYGTAQPMVASVPDSDAAHAGAEPQAAGVPVGRRAGVGGHDRVVGQPFGQLPGDPHGVDRLGRQHALPLHGVPPAVDVLLDRLRATTGRPCGSQQRNQRAERGPGVGDDVDLGRIAHPDGAAVDVDLHRAGRAVLGQELAVGKVGSDDQQGVAVAHQLIARPGAEQADRPGDVRQVVGQNVLAQQRLCHAGAGQLGDRRAPRRPRSARPGRSGWRPCRPR